ncbi:MAG: hypothetical protein LBG69_05745 [Zoogloeaceae bacterium]|jgi:pyruvate,water dikinase|nr:hypothetical protein [Zoogloeaceae bacterium]
MDERLVDFYYMVYGRGCRVEGIKYGVKNQRRATKTAQVNGELWELSRKIRADSALFALTRGDRSGAEIFARLAEFPAFHAEFQCFLQRHGHRELDFDAYCPTWVEAPHIVLDQIKVLAALPEEANGAGETQRNPNSPRKIAAVEAELRLLALVPERLRYAVREIIRLARGYTELDDLEHYQTTRLTLPFRRALKALGERLKNKEFWTRRTIFISAPPLCVKAPCAPMPWRKFAGRWIGIRKAG